MSTRIKVFNYVMTAAPAEVAQTLDEARALLATRRTPAGTKPPLTPQARAAITKAKQKAAKLAAEQKATKELLKDTKLDETIEQLKASLAKPNGKSKSKPKSTPMIDPTMVTSSTL